jgi:prenyltransferase beta subunit
MTFRAAMLAAARKATDLPEVDAAEVAAFLRRQASSTGGFADRAGAPDLYYTVFGVEALLAVDALDEDQRELSRSYLAGFGGGGQLDLVELACLARCWADLGGADDELAQAMLDRLEDFHCVDGGFSQTTGYDQPGVYGCFLAAGISEDLTGRIEPADEIIKVLEASRTSQGAYSADNMGLAGTVPTTAAAVVVLDRLGIEVDLRAGRWLKSRCSDGAFYAVEGAPVGDLLSTAVALHALRALGTGIEDIRESCRSFVAGLRGDDGGWRGTSLDSLADCEYTFYALLALGHLVEGS